MKNKKLLILTALVAIISIACSCGMLDTIKNNLPVNLDDVNPDAIATQIAEQLPQLTSIIGDILETPSADADAQPAAEPDFNNLSEGLDNLDSFRVKMSMVVSGVDESGTTRQETTEITQEVIKSLQKYHFAVSSIKEEATEQIVEMYSFADGFYMLDPNNTSGSGQACIAMTANEDMGSQMDAYEIISPEDMLNGNDDAQLVERGVMMNNIMTDHYKANNPAAAQFGNVPATVEMWVAQEGAYVVRFVGDGKSENAITSSGTSINGTFHWEYDLFDANQVADISLPEECVQAKEGGLNSLPQPANATNVSGFGSMLTLTSSDAPGDVAEFYKNALPRAGYNLDESSNMETMFLLTFSKDGKKLSLMITAGENGGSNVILTEE